ncbi:MAG: OmpA family protein [Cyclobacteriaceae bacterium]|nr:OmpA family protein [Cyclobacteriaceae bacterium]
MLKSLRGLILIMVVTGAASSASAQAEPNYYVVIGVFAKLDNAVRYTNQANQRGFNAQYAINPVKKWNYVYLLQSTDKRKAYAFLIRLRAESEYKDAWVFTGQLGDGQAIEQKPIEQKPIEDKPIEIKPIEQKPIEEPVKVDPVVERPIEEKPVEQKPEVKKPAGKPFVFKMQTADGTLVNGEVHIQESTNASRYQVFKGNELVYIEAPKNARGNYVVVTQAPGYQPVSLILSYREPSPETGADGEAIIPIEVSKVKRGDYIDFTNVRFFRNSAILEPAAQNELDGLVDLMKESTGYKIRIHGHCNGNQDKEGSILGSSTNFFALEPGKNKIGKFSAKELTTERAATVKAYLVSQGIAASRIDIKGEGGKIPLYPEGGTLGQYNDRIEIEITKR